MQRKRVAEATKGVGRPKVGGPFELLDQNGRMVTDADLKGHHSLVSLPFAFPMVVPAANNRPGLLWLLALSGHLSRGARQDGSHV